MVKCGTLCGLSLLLLFTSLYIVPTPNVIVLTALNNQQVGDPLLLECNVTTVRGITSSVDIVWITSDEEVRTVNNVSGKTIDNSVVYSNTYQTSILTEKDVSNIYQCKAVIGSKISMNTSFYPVIGEN